MEPNIEVYSRQVCYDLIEHVPIASKYDMNSCSEWREYAKWTDQTQ